MNKFSSRAAHLVSRLLTNSESNSIEIEGFRNNVGNNTAVPLAPTFGRSFWR